MPQGPVRIKLVGEYAYVLTDGGWQVLHITDPANPVEVGQNWKIGGFVPAGSNVYATVAGGERNNRRLFDVTDPANPKSGQQIVITALQPTDPTTTDTTTR